MPLAVVFGRPHGLPLRVHLQREAAEVNYGPYSAFSMVNGVAYAEATVFGFEDTQMGDWYSVQDRMHWGVMVLIAERI